MRPVLAPLLRHPPRIFFGAAVVTLVLLLRAWSVGSPFAASSLLTPAARHAAVKAEEARLGHLYRARHLEKKAIRLREMGAKSVADVDFWSFRHATFLWDWYTPVSVVREKPRHTQWRARQLSHYYTGGRSRHIVSDGTFPNRFNTLLPSQCDRARRDGRPLNRWCCALYTNCSIGRAYHWRELEGSAMAERCGIGINLYVPCNKLAVEPDWNN